MIMSVPLGFKTRWASFRTTVGSLTTDKTWAKITISKVASASGSRFDLDNKICLLGYCDFA